MNAEVLIEFTIPGKPVGKERPRMGKNGKFYTPKRTRDFESLIRQVAIVARNRVKIYKPLDEPVAVQIIIFHCNNQFGDMDNIIKSILDGMNKIIYHDDKQVSEIKCMRITDITDRTDVRIETK